MSHAAQIIQCPVLSPHGKSITSKLTTGARENRVMQNRERLFKKYTARKRDKPSLRPWIQAKSSELKKCQD